MTVDEIYHFIGQTIVDGIPEDWISAELNVERLDKYVRAAGAFVDKAGQTRVLEHAELGSLFAIHIHELHSIMTEGGNNRWNRLVVHLQPNGKFSIDFIWDQEFQNKVESV
jgi:hypothetical protein